MKKLNKCYMTKAMYPENKECILPGLLLLTAVPVNSFMNSLFSLLMASDLMVSDNLLFADANDPSIVPA